MAEFSEAISRLVRDEKPGVKLFSDIVGRLANTGTIVAQDSNLERELYEAAVQIEDEVSDFFSLLGCTLFHNQPLAYFRVFPPAAKSPCVAQSAGLGDDGAEPASAVLRRRGNPHVSAVLIAVRAIYQQKIATGDLSSGRGEVSTSVEEIYVSLKARLKRDPALGASERRAVLRELESLWRVIRIPIDSDPDDRQTRIVIRPMIADLIGEAVALRAEEDAAELGEDTEAKGETDASE